VRELSVRCRPSDRGHVSFCALRLRAAVLLAGGSGLRIGELCKLDAVQVIDDPSVPRWKLRSVGYLKAAQSKGRRVGPDQWDSAGSFLVSDDARAALRAYLAEAKRREYLAWPPKPGDALFVSVRGNGKSGAGRHRLSVRTLQWQWESFQRHAGLDAPYHWHCLRHDAMTRCSLATNGNLKIVAAFGRCDVLTAARYVENPSPQAMLDLRNQVAMR
jgi:integrase